MSFVRRWFLLGTAVLSIVVGFGFGITFMMHTIQIFNTAIDSAGRDPVNLIVNLAHGIKGILAWIVFGLTMTNALIIASSLSLPLLLGKSDSCK